MPKSKKRKWRRLNFRVSEELVEEMERCGEACGATNLTESLRRMMAVADMVIKTIQKGGRVVLIDKKGNEENLKLV